MASLDQATDSDWGTSTRYREIMAPLGLGDEARIALRVNGATWGVLCLHRSRRDLVAALTRPPS